MFGKEAKKEDGPVEGLRKEPPECWSCRRPTGQVVLLSVRYGMAGKDIDNTAYAICDLCEGDAGKVFIAAMDEWARVLDENQQNGGD